MAAVDRGICLNTEPLYGKDIVGFIRQIMIAQRLAFANKYFVISKDVTIWTALNLVIA